MRLAKLARTLPRFGWAPYVLAAACEGRESLDWGRLAALEQVPVVRVKEPRSLLHAGLALRGRPRALVAQVAATDTVDIRIS